MNVEPGFYIHEFHQQQKFGQLSGHLKVVDYHYEEIMDHVSLEWLERDIFEDIMRLILDDPNVYGSSFG